MAKAKRTLPERLFVARYEADWYTHCGTTSIKETISRADEPTVIGEYRLVREALYEGELVMRVRKIKATTPAPDAKETR